MIRTICVCDRCGREIPDGEEVFRADMGVWHEADGSIWNIPTEKNNDTLCFCKNCMEEILWNVPVKPSESHTDDLTDDMDYLPSVEENEQETANTSESEPVEEQKPEEESKEPVEEPEEPEIQKKRKTGWKCLDVGISPKPEKDGAVDVNKVFALAKAGWTQKKIAEEINRSTGTVNKILNGTYKGKVKKGAPCDYGNYSEGR